MNKFTITIISILLFNITLAQNPNLQWAKQFGSFSADWGLSVAVDASGNVYTTGSFAGTVDFDPGAGINNLTSAGNDDVFISKLDAAGNFIWAKQLGGPNSDYAYSITVDALGNVYTTGSFVGTADFDPGATNFMFTSVGSSDVFISKIDASGNFIWAKQMGGASQDQANSIAVDAFGNVYTTGQFQITADFDPGTSSFTLNSAGGIDIFISKLDAAGNFAWAKQLGATSNDVGNSVALDASGNIYTTGTFQGTADFDPGVATFTLTSAGGSDTFILKLDAAGNFVWTKQFGGTSAQVAFSITLDASGDIYTAGYFAGTTDFDPGVASFTLTPAGPYNSFISKLNAAGNFVWAKQLVGTSGDQAYSIALDALGNIYTAGYFASTVDFDPGVATFTLTSAGHYDAFISKLDAAGNFVWAIQMGGASADAANSITLDAAGNVYTTGSFYGTSDFDPSAATFFLIAPASSTDAFVHKMSQTTVGMQENNVSLNTSTIYPNPADNYFTFESTTTIGALTVIDITGKIVYKQTVNKNKTSINTSALSNGIYVIKITDADNTPVSTKRLVISK